MKIRNPTIIKWIGFFGALIIRVWISTLAYRYHPLGRNMDPCRDQLKGRFLYTFWHENILVPCYQYRKRNIQVLISEHADGEMIAQVCKHIGYGTIRGSKTRGGMKAMRAMIRAASDCHIAVMPDGPRGPRRHVELGLIYLAAKTGMPIIPIGVGYDRPWRLNTWDRFALPRPFSQAVVVSLEPVHIPEGADKAELEEYRRQIEKALVEVSEYAERLASRTAVEAPMTPVEQRKAA
jgi:lysophospholipid acyltransferase (LPLAT)-like uncharacterized protein